MKKYFLLIFIFSSFVFANPIEELRYAGIRDLRIYTIKKECEKVRRAKESNLLTLSQEGPENIPVSFRNASGVSLIMVLKDDIIPLGTDVLSQPFNLSENGEIELIPVYGYVNDKMDFEKSFKFKLPDDLDFIVNIIYEDGTMKLQIYNGIINPYDISDYNINFH